MDKNKENKQYWVKRKSLLWLSFFLERIHFNSMIAFEQYECSKMLLKSLW